MIITPYGWSNKKGTSIRSCKCGSWQQHWLNYSNQPWPQNCSVDGCFSSPTLGAHIYNPQVKGEKIIPMCNSCNQLEYSFNLRGSISLVSANTSETCG